MEKKRYHIGIIGGGQLAQMMVPYARQLGFDITVLDPLPQAPAVLAGATHLPGRYEDSKAIRTLAHQCDLITIELEHVSARTLQELHDEGVEIQPHPRAISLIQNKLKQKEALSTHGVAVAPFRAVTSSADLAQAATDWGYPLHLKQSFASYDGKGNRVIRSASDIETAFAEFSQDTWGLFVEQDVPFTRELAVMVVKEKGGQLYLYPVVETVQRSNVCDVVRLPVALSAHQQQQIEALVTRALSVLPGAGVFGIELFQTEDGILVNEIAPRVHNSGHYTIEVCETSQFENHLRAITGLPIGSTDIRPSVQAAVMKNILGVKVAPAQLGNLEVLKLHSEVYLHWYGKKEEKPGRKMGHITVLAATVTAAEALAEEVRNTITISVQ
jgi:phosphoribosylaminoimidazole carboxylase PurK protein